MLLRLFLVLLIGALTSLQAEVKPSKMFADHMVLQRNIPIPIWGTADPGETIFAELNGQKETVRAGSDGQWMIRLKPIAKGLNLELKITGSSTPTPITFKDVVMGEVWVCSGQSNMNFQMRNVKNSTEEIQAANNPHIRLFIVSRQTSETPLHDLKGEWMLCNPTNVQFFSAVGYFFGREIQNYLQVPVGLIHTAWGGTPAEAWTRRGALENDADFAPMLDRFEKWKETVSPEKLKMELDAWEKQRTDMLKEAHLLCSKPTPPQASWLDTNNSDPKWKNIQLPVIWQKLPELKMNGSIWFRKVVDIPAEAISKPLTLSLGHVDDCDFTWINDKLVGKTDYDDAIKPHLVARNYPLPAGTFKEGKNVIMIRVVDAGWSGGFETQPEIMYVGSKETGWKLPLSGEWEYQVEKNLGLLPKTPAYDWQNYPSTLYNGMVAPVIPYGIKGVIWYQGESNDARAEQYRKLFPTLIRNWRQDWGEGDFPFYFVQLANYRAAATVPEESAWAELREAQTKALSLPNTGMAVIIDIGEAGDIHPKNKQDVGKRLALWALAKNYGASTPTNPLGNFPVFRNFFRKPIEYSGPLYKNMSIKDSEVTLCFDHIGKGLMAKNGDSLKGFAIAGDDKHFVWANAKISGSCVVVSSTEVPNPKAVRYNWANNPDGNLYNSEGLPASPFRTDDWPGVTTGKR